jgi:hypothetical protein
VHAIVPSTAASLSGVPRRNTDSNWIKVSQRVPVLISFDEADRDRVRRLPTDSSVTVRLKEERVYGAAAAPSAGAPPVHTRPPGLSPTILGQAGEREAERIVGTVIDAIRPTLPESFVEHCPLVPGE